MIQHTWIHWIDRIRLRGLYLTKAVVGITVIYENGEQEYLSAWVFRTGWGYSITFDQFIRDQDRYFRLRESILSFLRQGEPY